MLHTRSYLTERGSKEILKSDQKFHTTPQKPHFNENTPDQALCQRKCKGLNLRENGYDYLHCKENNLFLLKETFSGWHFL